jgi:ankyrin repeat protein
LEVISASGIDHLVSALFASVNARPLNIPTLAELAKILSASASSNATLSGLKARIFQELLKAFNCRKPVPKQAASFAFFFQCFECGLISVDDVLSLTKQISENTKLFRSVCWILAYFAPELETADPTFTEELITSLQSHSNRSSSPQILKAFSEDLSRTRSENWAIVKRNRNFWTHSLTFFSLIRDDNLTHLKRLARSPAFSLDICIPPMPYLPSPALFNFPTLIQTAAFFGSIRCFRFLLCNGSNLLLLDRNFVTLSQMAIAGGNLEIIRLCQFYSLDFSGAVHASVKYHRHAIFDWLFPTVPPERSLDLFGQNLCHLACESNNIRVLSDLCSGRVSISARSDYHRVTPLEIAVAERHPECVELLLADPTVDVRSAPLCVAVKNGDLAIARLLIERGAFARSSRENARALLVLAARQQHAEMVRYLLTVPGIDPNSTTTVGATALLAAASCGFEKVCEALAADPRVDPNAATAEGLSVLYFAVKRKLRGLFALLLKRPDIDLAARTLRGVTLLHIAARDAGMAHALLERGEIDINAVDSHGETALHKAAMAGNAEVVGILLAHGIDTNVVAVKGGLALHFAIGRSDELIAEMIIGCSRAEINYCTEECPSPINLAMQKGCRRVVEALLRRGDVVLTGLVGVKNLWPPLPFAAQSGMKDVFEMVIGHPNMDVANPDCGANVALTIVLQMGLLECVEALKPIPNVVDKKREGSEKKRTKFGFWKRIWRRRCSSNTA